MDKHSSLLQKFINYGQKSFITFGPGLSLKVYSSKQQKEDFLEFQDFEKKSFLPKPFFSVSELGLILK